MNKTIGLQSDWITEVFASPPDRAWIELFKCIQTWVPDSHTDLKTHYQTIETRVEKLDRLLSTSGWELWQNFAQAPRGSQAVLDFWKTTIGPKAVLILDSLSVREISSVLIQAKAVGCEVTSVTLAGSELPSETDFYAQAIGLPGRASLKKRPLPASFTCSGQDTYADTFQVDFAETTAKLPNEKNIFLWHGWPDDVLHDLAKSENAFNRFIEQVQTTLDSDGFRELLRVLSRGRELLITSDHGYCHAAGFVATQGDAHLALKPLGHTRARKLNEITDTSKKVITPPATLDLKATSNEDIYRLALGRQRPTDKGFPALTHGGLSLLECTVPLIRLRGPSNV
jgi:hypothetical protein